MGGWETGLPGQASGHAVQRRGGRGADRPEPVPRAHQVRQGYSNEHPPTPAEWERLYQSCEVLGHYAPQMRALMIVAAYSGMRPGELMALEWGDIDFEANRIYVQRRLYQG